MVDVHDDIAPVIGGSPEARGSREKQTCKGAGVQMWGDVASVSACRPGGADVYGRRAGDDGESAGAPRHDDGGPHAGPRLPLPRCNF